MNPELRKIRWLTAFFIFGLVISGLTAIPLPTELNWLNVVTSKSAGQQETELTVWLAKIRGALNENSKNYPFLFYGTDWLAFGHFMIAVAFVGAWRDPIRNRWLFDFGLLACLCIIPYALIFGEIRSIPVWWRLIDCSFGLFGAVPLLLCRKWVRELEAEQTRVSSYQRSSNQSKSIEPLTTVN